MRGRRAAAGAGLALAVLLAQSTASAELLKRARPLPIPVEPPPPPSPTGFRPREFPFFEMKDGTRVVGGFPQAALDVETPYGVLTVPVSEVLRIRFGTRSDPELAGRIEALVRQLGDADFAVREAATRALEATGLPARRALEAALASGDAEVQERAGRVIESLDALDEPPPPEEDEVQTRRFTVRGAVRCPAFRVETKYGTLTVEKRHLVRLVLQVPGERLVLKVPATHESQNLLDTGLEVGRGDRLEIRATGTVTLANWGQMAGPEGNPNCGQQVAALPVGTLVGRIGSGGPLFKVGERYQGTADRGGRLFLGLATANCAQQNTGEFRAAVAVERGP